MMRLIIGRNAGVTVKPIYIYGLVDPETQEVRYIGKSIRPFERLQNHMNDKSKCHRANWLQGLKRKGMQPELVIFEMIQGARPWQEAERYWIARANALGWPLTNNTSGGDGVPDLPQETRDRMRRVWLGRKHKPETLEKLSAVSKGRRKTEEQKQHMKKLMKGREITWGDTLSKAMRKLSASDIMEIKKRLNSGELVKDLAEEYSVHRTTLSKVKNGTYGLKYDGKGRSGK